MPRSKQPKKTVILHIRVEEELAQSLQDMADADARKLSPYVAMVLRRHVETETEGKGGSRSKQP